MRNRWWATTAFAAATLTIAACGSGSSGGSGSGASGSSGSTASPASSAQAASTSAMVKTTKIGGATVLTNAKGLTLYSFAPDTATKSNCNGQCAKFWPPLKGPVTGSGLSGKFGTIKRADGSTQATFNGHPLYTYEADTAPGEAKGNNLTVSGGLWKEIAVTGSAAPAANPPASSSSSSSGGSGGYGY